MEELDYYKSKDELATVLADFLTYHTSFSPIALAQYLTDKGFIWRCKCECGRETITKGVSLRVGNTESCGLCGLSRGEERIEKILIEQNVNFVRQYKIEECKNVYALPFDFAIFEENILLCLIEYQGRQHYKEGFVFDNGEDSLEYRQYRDDIKREYCRKNNIKLIEIPYTDFEKVSWTYLKEKIYG